MCGPIPPYTPEESARISHIASFLAGLLTLLLGAALGWLVAYIQFRLL